MGTASIRHACLCDPALPALVPSRVSTLAVTPVRAPLQSPECLCPGVRGICPAPSVTSLPARLRPPGRGCDLGDGDGESSSVFRDLSFERSCSSFQSRFVLHVSQVPFLSRTAPARRIKWGRVAWPSLQKPAPPLPSESAEPKEKKKNLSIYEKWAPCLLSTRWYMYLACNVLPYPGMTAL